MHSGEERTARLITDDDDIIIYPKRIRNAVLIVLLSLVMTAASYAIVEWGTKTWHPYLGWFGILFFGGGGAVGLWTSLRTPWSVALRGDALEIRTRGHIGQIPWRDIDDVALTNIQGTKMPGLRLASSEAYLQSFKTGPRRAITRKLLNTNRGITGGYDLVLSWIQIDRPAREFTEFLKQEWIRRR